MNVINTRLLQRLDTLQNWQTTDPVLLSGELAIVSSSTRMQFKVGNGTSTFNQLPYTDANLSTNAEAIGTGVSVQADGSFATGINAQASALNTFVFNGDNSLVLDQNNHLAFPPPYKDHGNGTFNVNAPLSDIYIQQSAFSDILSNNVNERLLQTATWPAWQSGVYYSPHKIVSHNGRLWSSLEPDTYEEPSEDAYQWTSVSISSILTRYSLTTHSHGAIANNGALTAAGTAISNNDSLVFVDSSDSSKIKKTSITFDGSTNNEFLSKKGVWTEALTAVPSSYKTYDSTVSTLSDDGYVLSSQLTSKADVSALNAKITIDDQISSICAQTDLSIVKLSADDYAQLVATSSTISNCLYVVEDDIINAYGQQISNLAPGTSLSDAVNLEQLCDAVSSIQMPSDLSSFTNSPGYLVSDDISNYYQKSETSSKTEIDAALSNKSTVMFVEWED